MNKKKFYLILALVFTLMFATKAIASLTFTTNAITGTTASTIDVGAGNMLSLQTTNNGAITTGSGLFTLGGSLVASLIRPASNSTTAIQIDKADGVTNILDVDTTNRRIGFGTTTPTVAFDIKRSGGSGSLDLGVTNTDDATSSASVFVQNDGSKNGNMRVFGSTATGTAAGFSKANMVQFIAGTNPSSMFVGQSALNGPIIFGYAVSSSPVMTITTDLNVGIGTTAPGGKFDVKDGHYVSSQTTAPTPSVTGTGYTVGSMTTGSTDTKGSVTATVGANVGTIVVSFNTGYTTAPICTVSPDTPTVQVDVAKMYVTSSISFLTLNFVATPTGGSESWNYICMQ